MKYVLMVAAVLVVCCALVLRGAPQTDARKVVVVNGAPASMSLPSERSQTPSPNARVVDRSTHVSTDPRQLYASLRSEPRDVAWASRSESFIRTTLANMPDLGSGAPLDVRCAATLCEASGVAAAGAPPDELQRVWDSVRGTIDTPLIAAHGLRYVTATYGSGHSIHAFTIYYRRSAE